MNDNLNFGIHFDLEKGLKDAQADWAKVEKEFTNKTIKIKVSVPKATTIDNLEEVTKRLKELKIEPVTLETKSAIQSLVRELKSMEKVLIEINRLNNNSKVPIVTAKANKVNASIVQQEALAQEKLTQAKIRTEKAQLQLEAAQRKGTATTKAHTSAYSKQAGMLDSLKRTFAAYTGLFAVARIVTKIREITGEFELQRVALGAIIQDVTKANLIFSQIKSAALESPFQVKELVTYTKQLAAYRIETENLFYTTMRLADISAGLGVEMDRLVLAYGQVKAASVLRGQELRQFTEAGIPLVQLLADKFTILNGETVTTGEVFELISKRAVSFEMVKEIFEDMTNAGGVFYNMQEIQSKTLAGSWSNLKDAADIAFSEMGESQLGTMKDVVNAFKELLDNWEYFAKVLTQSIGVFSIYKIAVFAAGGSTRFLAQTQVLATASTNLFTAGQIKAANATGLASAATNIFTRSLYKLYAAFLKNPYAWVAAGLAAIVAVIYNLVSKQSDLEKVTKKLGDISLENLTKAKQLANDFNSLANAAISSADGSKEQEEALKELGRTYKDIIPAQSLTIQNLRAMKGNYDEVTKAIYSKIAAQNKEMLISKVNEEMGGDIQENMNDLAKNLKDSFKNVSDTSILKFIAEVKQQISEGAIALSKDSAKFYENADKITQLGKKYGIKLDFSFGQQETRSLFLDLADAVTDYNKAIEKTLILNNETFENTTKYSVDIKKLKDDFNTLTLSMTEDGKKLSQNEIKFKIGEFEYNEQTTKFQIIRYKNFLKAKFEDAKVKISVDDFIQWSDALGTKNESQIPNLVKTALNGMLKSQPDLFKAAQEIKTSILNIGGDDVRAKLITTFREIAAETGYSMDKASKYLKGNEENWQDWSKRIKEANEEAKFTLNQPFLTEKAIKETQQEMTFITSLISVFAQLFSAPDKKASKSRADLLKEELSLVEKAYKAYQDLSNVIGKASAKNKIQELYGGQTKFLSLAFSEKDMKKELAKVQKTMKTKADKLEIGVKISEVDFDTLQKQLKDNLDKIKDEINQEQQKIDFFDSIFKSTGDKTKAEQMTSQLFGTIGNLKELVKNQLTSIFEEPMNLSLNILKSQPLTPELQTEIDKINEFKSAFHDATNGVKVDYDTLRGLIKQLPKESQAAAQDWIDSSVNANAKVVQDIMDSLGKYKTFDERRKEIWDKYLADVANMGVDSGFSQADVEARRKLAAQLLSDLSAEQFKASEDWQKTFGDLDILASTTIDRLITNLENLIKTDKNLSPENLKLYKEEIDKLKAQKVKDNPFKAITEGLNEYIDATKKLNAEQSKAEPNAKVIETAIEAQKVALKKLESGVQAASAAFSQLQSFVSSINELFGATEDTELGAFMLDLAEALGYVASALGVVAAAIAVIDALGAPFLIIAAAIAGIVALGMWISSSDTRKSNKEIEKQEKIIAELERSYKKLQEASEKAFGVDWLKAQEAELENLKALQIAYEKQAQAERDKGKDKDEEKLLEYENNAKDTADRIAAYQDNLIKKFTGTDLTSFASDLAKAYLDAYIAIGRQGAITTDELKNQWRSLVKNMVVESFVASAIQGAFQQTFEDITKLYENSKIPTAEEINALTQQGAGVIDILGTTLPQLLEGLDLSGLGDASSELSGLSKSISGATEQQINTLSAAINTQNFYLFTMMTIMKKWDVDNVTQTTTMTNLFTIQNSFLQELPFIRQNTENTVTACNNIAATCNDIKSTLNAVTQISGAKKCVNTIVN